jgi:outer membrane protein OmpU
VGNDVEKRRFGNTCLSKENTMKKVLLSTTALVFAAGVASAEISMSGSATIKSSNFGTGATGTAAGGAAAGDQVISAETDVVITLSGGNGDISYSASLELDETGGLSDGPLNVTMGGFSLDYDDGALGMVATDGDGEDDAYGDYKLSYSMGGLTASYTGDNESDDNIMSIGYSADGMSITVTDTTETASAAGGAANEGNANGAKDETKIAVSYAMGAYTVSASSANEATAGNTYDVSVAYDMGNGTTITVGTDEASTHFISASADLGGGLSMTAKQEVNADDAAGNNETELSVSYTAGAMSFSVAYDSGQGITQHFGDEAETVISASYDLGGGATLAAKATGEDEMEMSIGFKF